MIAVGTRVSYEDMANPLREGAIVGEVAGQWAVLWDADHAVGYETTTVPVPKGDDVVLVEFHTTVTKDTLERAAERQEQASGRVAGWNVRAAERVTWLDPPVVGNHVRVRTVGPTWESTSSGTYLGVLRSDHDGQPCHYFVNGEINGLAQGCFGFPALPGTEVTDERTPTAAIIATHTGEVLARVAFAEPHAQLLEEAREAVDSGWASRTDSGFAFDVEGPLACWDEDDPESGPLFVQWLAADGTAARFKAEKCDGVNELERRLYRDVAPEFTIQEVGS